MPSNDKKTVLIETVENISVLRLNRPDSRNAMNDEMAEQFSAAIDTIVDEGQARALIVTGNGPAFCAGGDLAGFAKWAGMQPAEVAEALRLFYARFLRIMDLPIPTIAAINGPAVGAGACLAAACDIRLAAASARIGFTFVKLGINPGMGSEYLLNRIVGPARTVELLMTGDVISAADARQMGLVNRVVLPESLMNAAFDLACRLAKLPSSIVKVIRENTSAAVASAPIADILRREAREQAPIFTDPDFQKKIQQMLENLGGEEDR
jgi:enoyl-CoA hydratase